jgi:diguanylate cyclase (GGDEF)-like protein
LYVVDVDNLKPVNDAYGHAAGDSMLIDLVMRARAWLGPRDWIGRLGGDEFVMCVHDGLAASNAKVQRWLDALAAPSADRRQIRASAGCAQYRPGVDAMQLAPRSRRGDVPGKGRRRRQIDLRRRRARTTCVRHRGG